MGSGKPEKLSASQEDYLETIYNLTADSGVARSREIAEKLGVTASSVTGALRNLAQKELIHYQPYGYVTLTETGRAAAQRVVRRHRVIESFFVDILGLEEELSRQAACRAEHALGPEIINRLTLFIEYISNEKLQKGHSVSEFELYCRNIAARRQAPGG